MRSKDYNLDVDALVRYVEAQNNLHQYKPHEKAVSKWCKEHEVQEIERLKLPSDFYKMTRDEQDAEIAKAIKAIYPDRIEEKIYHFPFQWFYLITDKGYYFTLKSKARPRTDKEESKISRLRETVKSMEKDKVFQNARSLYLNAKSFYDNGMKEVANLIFTQKAHDIMLSYQESMEEINDAVAKLEKKCRHEKYYSLTPHELTRQVSIYINGRIVVTLERLGYKIHSVTRTETVREWNEQYLNWDYKEVEAKHLFIKVSNTVFESACKTGRLLPKGKYLDEDGNEVEMKKGRAKGCVNEHLRKEIALFDPMTNQVLSFSSIQDAAKELGVDKGNLSKKLKGLSAGDSVTIKKKRYIIGNT